MQATHKITAASAMRCSHGSRAAGWLVAASLSLALVLIARSAAADAPLVIDPDRQFDFAASLFADRNFPEAIVEYRRFIHFFPNDPRADTAMYRIGRSYFNDRRFGRAIEAFFALIEAFPKSRWTVPAYRGIAACHLQNNAPGQAVALLEQLIAVTDDPEVVDDANYRIGWIYLEMADWDRAGDYFDRIRPENRAAYRIRQLSEALEKVPAIPKKHPTTAGLLALLPGAGHFYCGRYRDAFIALAVNVALIAAAVESFDNDLPILGGVIAAVELGFYSGSIYSAVGSAHKYNRARDRAFIENLKKEARPMLSFGASAGGVMASLQIPF